MLVLLIAEQVIVAAVLGARDRVDRIPQVRCIIFPMTRPQTRRPTWLLAASSAFILLLAGSPSSKADLIERDGARALRVLFVGNSLTYSNDLPAIVEALAKATNQGMFAYKSIAIPDFSLEDHWNRKDALQAIRKGQWDYLVLQQGPSAFPEGRALLLEYGRRFAEVIRQRGGRPALYSVWPARTRIQDFKGVSESYRQAAEAVDGVLFPVGDAWLNAWKDNPSIGLYSADGFHPSVAGSYLAGLVIYEKLYNRSPVGLPSKLKLSSGARIEIPADQALVLQQAAEAANKSYGRR